MALSEDYLRSVSESDLKDRAFTPFELAKHERESLEDIRKGIKEDKYKNKDKIQESLEFIENLSNRMSIAINNEKKEGKLNWELESDLADVKKVFDLLNALMQKMETKEVDDAVIKDNTHKKSRISINHKDEM